MKKIVNTILYTDQKDQISYTMHGSFLYQLVSILKYVPSALVRELSLKGAINPEIHASLHER